MKKEKNILLILGFGLLGRIILSQYGTLELDFNTYLAWSRQLSTNGFSNFYSGWSDYLPGYLYVLWVLGLINKLNLINTVLLFKLPAILADLGSAYLIYLTVKAKKSEKWASVASVLYLFNPAILSNSTLWGQTDSLVSLCALVSFYLVEKNFGSSAIVLAIGTAIKPQSAFIAPLILLKMFNKKWGIIKIFSYSVLVLSVFLGLFIPFSHGNLINFIVQRISLSLGQYPYTSVNAFNSWAIYGMWASENGAISKNIIGYLINIIIIGGYGIYFQRKKLFRKELNYYRFGALIFLSTFMFLTRMHERHMLPVFAFLVISASESIVLGYLYLILSLSYSINMVYAYVWITENFKEIIKNNLVILISLVNSLSVGVLIFEEQITKLVTKFKKEEEIRFSHIELKNPKAILIGILLISLITRVWGINSPTQEYFDEVYHAFTARSMLNLDKRAWEWWNNAPEGYAFEWTHPPMAKIGMVVSMKILGENAMGWRMPSVLLGVGVTYLIYLVSKELFKDEWAALIASGVFALDGLGLVLSRIGMNDMYFLTFMMGTLYLFIKKKDLMAATGLGLAAASKWSVIWFLPILFIAHILLERKLRISYIFYLFIPIMVYLLSYSGMFWSGHDWEQFKEVQKQMWWYHTRLSAEHAYTSPWWSWPLLVRPIWLYTSGVVAGRVANIYAMGNPVVFWFGLSSIIISVYVAIKERSKKLLLIVAGYLIFFVSWAVSPRIMFLYHYLPSVPFMAIALGVTLRKYKELTPWFFILAIAAFIYFYPHWTGISVPLSLDKSYYWFKSWR